MPHRNRQVAPFQRGSNGWAIGFTLLGFTPGIAHDRIAPCRAVCPSARQRHSPRITLISDRAGRDLARSCKPPARRSAGAEVTGIEFTSKLPYGTFRSGDYVIWEGHIQGELSPQEAIPGIDKAARNERGRVSGTSRRFVGVKFL